MLIRLRPGAERRGDDPAWHDALVFVARGTIEVGTVRWRFGKGSVLVLDGLAVRNPGPEEALLVTYARAFVHSALWSFLAAW
jgi:hypothetical protein